MQETERITGKVQGHSEQLEAWMRWNERDSGATFFFHLSGFFTLAELWVRVSLFLCTYTAPSIVSVLMENLGKLSASSEVKGMQMDKTVSLALFMVFILVLNSYVHGIVPYVSSQPSDMGFCMGEEDIMLRGARGFNSKGCCSWSFWLKCWNCSVSFVLGRGGKLA